MKKKLEKKAKAKPLSFSTTLRNPERIISFLQVIKKYNGKILTHEIIVDIICDVIINKLYKPMIINRNKTYKDIYESTKFFTKKHSSNHW